MSFSSAVGGLATGGNTALGYVAPAAPGGPGPATGYTLDVSPSSVVVGSPVTITATLSPSGASLPAPLVITLQDSLASTVSGTITIADGSQSGTATVTPSAAGTHGITGSHTGGGFTGGDSIAAFTATAKTLAMSVSDPDGQTVTATVTPNAAYTGTATVTPSGPAASGLSPVVLTFAGSSSPQTATFETTETGDLILTLTRSDSTFTLSGATSTVEITDTVEATARVNPGPGYAGNQGWTATAAIRSVANNIFTPVEADLTAVEAGTGTGVYYYQFQGTPGATYSVLFTLTNGSVSLTLEDRVTVARTASGGIGLGQLEDALAALLVATEPDDYPDGSLWDLLKWGGDYGTRAVSATNTTLVVAGDLGPDVAQSQVYAFDPSGGVQRRYVASWNANTKTLTVETAWTTNPQAGWKVALGSGPAYARADMAQPLANVVTGTVGGAFHGAWATSWGNVVVDKVAKLLKVVGLGSAQTPARTFNLDNGNSPTSRTAQ